MRFFAQYYPRMFCTNLEVKPSEYPDRQLDAGNALKKWYKVSQIPNQHEFAQHWYLQAESKRPDIFTLVLCRNRPQICDGKCLSLEGPLGNYWLQFDVWGSTMKICHTVMQSPLYIRSSTRTGHAQASRVLPGNLVCFFLYCYSLQGGE